MQWIPEVFECLSRQAETRIVQISLLQVLHKVCCQFETIKANMALKPKIFNVSRREIRGVVREIINWMIVGIQIWRLNCIQVICHVNRYRLRGAQRVGKIPRLSVDRRGITQQRTGLYRQRWRQRGMFLSQSY
jgi:hypothetical protein